MLAIKLKKAGRKNQRTFRLIVQEDREKLDGKNAEDLGWFNPHTNQFKINKDRADYWVKNGAKPTDSASKLLEKVKNSEASGYEAIGGRKKNKKTKGQESASAEGGGSEEAPVTAETEASAPAEEAEEVKAEEVAEEPASPAEEVPSETTPEETPAEEVSENTENADVEEGKEGE